MNTPRRRPRRRARLPAEGQARSQARSTASWRTRAATGTRRALWVLPVLGVSLAVTGPTAARAVGPETAHHAGGPVEPDGLVVVDQTHWVAPDGEWELRLRAPQAPPGSVLELTLHDRLTGRIQFNEGLLGASPGPVRAQRCAALGAEAILVLDPCRLALDAAQVDAAGAVTIALALRADPSGPADRILLPGDGVYPVRVVLRGADGGIVDEVVTHLRRLPDPSDESAPLGVAVIVPVSAALAHRSDGTVELASADQEHLRALTEALAAHPGVPAVVVPRPETLDALAAAGDPTLATLATAVEDHPVVARPYVEVDPGAWWQEGLDAELEDLTRVGAATVTDRLDAAVDARTGLVGPTTDGRTLERLAASGVEHLVVPEELLPPLDQDAFPLALDQPFQAAGGDGPVLPALVDDAGLRAHIGRTGDPVLDAHRLLADLTVLYGQQPGVRRALAVSLPATGLGEPDTTREFLDTLLEGLEAGRMVAATPVDELLADATPATEPSGAPLVRPLLTQPPAGLGGYPAARREADAGLEPYRAILGDSEELAVADQLLRVSGDRSLQPDRWQPYLDGPRERLAAGVADGITAPEQSAVTLTAREGLVPLSLVNNTGREVHVTVHLDSDKLDFPDGAAVDTVLVPGENRLEVRVRARASGAFPVRVRVTSPDGNLELASTRFTLRSTAVPGIGLALSALAAAVLAAWWARHWRDARRARGLVAAPDTQLQDRVIEGIIDV